MFTQHLTWDETVQAILDGEPVQECLPGCDWADIIPTTALEQVRLVVNRQTTGVTARYRIKKEPAVSYIVVQSINNEDAMTLDEAREVVSGYFCGSVAKITWDGDGRAAAIELV